MKVFVLGSSGMLGTYVYKYFYQIGYDVVSVTRAELNAASANSMDILGLGITAGDVVINCMGLIKQRSGTTDLAFILVNSVFPRVVSNVCESVGAYFIHVTTDCVFDGLVGDYIESSPHTALDIYGRSKSLGEPENATVIRTSIIGEELANKLSLIEWVKSQAGKVVNGFTNHFWNGVTCLEFAKLCEIIINTDNFWLGVKHIHSPEVVNKYELIELISSAYGLGVVVVPFSTPTSCNRSLNSERESIVLPTPTLKEQLVELRSFNLS
jgi:dTDP-4-dehydrorhamnose reductase